MIQLAVRFKENADVQKFVDIMNRVPYHADLISGKHTVDAKSLLGVFSLSTACNLRLFIYANHDDIHSSYLSDLEKFSDQTAQSDRQKLA